MPMRSIFFSAMIILRVCYTPAAGADVEYGQGAIERNELAHHVLTDVTWLVRVTSPASSEEWQKRLDASVEQRHGRFSVEPASADEQTRAERGEIHFQQ
jgi:hypothetical protein